MKTIAANAVKLFTRNKGFFYIITIQPVFVFLLMSFLLPYTTTHNIALVGQRESAVSTKVTEAVQKLAGIKIIDVEEADINSKLMAGNIELAVVIDDADQIRIVSLGNSEVEDAVTLCIEQAAAAEYEGQSVQVNEAPAKGWSLSGSLGFMIYKTLTAGNVLAALIINERNQKMKDRILLSGTKSGAYLGGVSFVYLFFMMIGSAVYYIAALILGFDFGMRNSLGFLLLLFSANVLSTAIYLLVSTITQKEEALWFMATFILTPMGLFSGLLFPYEFMPPLMRTIGSFFPHRWIAHGIERIQRSGSIASAIPDLTLILGISLVLFIIAASRSSWKKQPVSG